MSEKEIKNCGTFSKKVPPEVFQRQSFTSYTPDLNSIPCANVTGTRCSLGGGKGIQVPCELNISGPENFMSVLRLKKILAFIKSFD